jgi:hypothetical protein
MKRTHQWLRAAFALASGVVLLQTSTCVVNDQLAAVRSISPYTSLQLSDGFRSTALDIILSRSSGEPLRGPSDVVPVRDPGALPVQGIVPMGFYPPASNGSISTRSLYFRFRE